MRERAPGKINLCLFLGPARADGRHELVTVFESVSLFDELTLTVASEDQVVCPEVRGPNLVTEAIRLLREHGWDGPPVRIEIAKRIPLAAGMAGGSADAAAALRLAAHLAPLPERTAVEIAAALGSDVPSQLTPGLALGTGAGDSIERLPAVAPHAHRDRAAPARAVDSRGVRRGRPARPRSQCGGVALRCRIDGRNGSV